MKWLNERSSKKRGRSRGLSKRNRTGISTPVLAPQCEWLEQRQLLSVSAPISLGDINLGTLDATITSPVVEFDGEKYFALSFEVDGPSFANSGTRMVTQIWRSDSGTGSLVQVADLGVSFSQTTQMVANSQGVYFDRSTSLWRTDGTLLC